MRQLVLPMLFAFLCAGCGSPSTYYKSGATQDEYDRAMATCRMKADMIPADPNVGKLGQIAVDMDFMDNCMVSQGWHIQKQ